MKKETSSAVAEQNPVKETIDLGFELEGLMNDFPTATELQKFVFDQTGITLNLKGRSNKVKYQIALDCLNGILPPTEVLGNENPYLDKNEIIPSEPLKTPPPQPAVVRGHIPVTQFQCNTFPHPDAEWGSMGQKCSVVFRLYVNNVITYEILGPIAQRAVGSRINKFGQSVPERYVWVDPREGEQVIRDENGRITAMGTRLKNFMSRLKVGNKTQWDTWIDREFIIGGNPAQALDNPWG